ncbi:MAG: DUF6732 family protein [Pseudomonadota bacterium]
MKTTLTALSLIAAAGTAAAHEGHVAPVAGHAHGEILAVVIAAAIVVGLYLAGRRA